MYSITVKNFDIHKIANSGQAFRFKQIDENTYSVVALGEYLEIRQIDDTLTFSCSEAKYHLLWEDYFDLKTEYDSLIGMMMGECSSILSDDFVLRAINDGRGIRILKQSFFETLISFIVSQRKSIPAIKTCIEKLCEKYGEETVGKTLDGQKIITHIFPDVSKLVRVSEEELKDCGLGYRAEYIVDACRWYSNWRVLPCKITKDLLVEEVKGVGEKVANCACLFGLHQLEACPKDVWIKRVIDEQYHGIEPEWARSKYAGLIQQYVFEYARRLEKKNGN